MMHRSRFFSWLRNPSGDPTKHPYATACTSDQLLVSACLQLAVKDFKGWAVKRRNNAKSTHYDERGKWIFFHEKKKLNVDLWCDRKRKGGQYTRRHVLDLTTLKGKINDLPISHKQALRFLKEMEKLEKAFEAAESVANKAALEMRNDKERWNLAEDLLGMKRLPNGALVPKDEYKHNKLNNCDACETIGAPCERHD